MDDRSARYVAAAIGLFFVLGLGAHAFRSRGPKLTLLSQRLIGEKQGPLATGPGILVRLGLSPEDDHLPSDYQIRLWDEHGTELPIKPLYVPGENDYLVPLGYGHPIIRPRVEAWLGGKRLGSTTLQAFPPPTDVHLVAKQNALYRLERRPSATEVGASFLVLRSLRPVPKDVEIAASILRTDHLTYAVPKPLSVWSVSDQVFGGTEISYGAEAHSAEVRLNTYRRVERSEELSLPSIPLVARGGETQACVASTLKIPNRLGCDLKLLPLSETKTRPSAVDHRRVRIDLVFPTIDQGRSLYSQAQFRIRPLSPKPETIGLSELSVGREVKKSTKPVRTPPPRAIDVKLRLTKSTYVLIGSTKMTLPIEAGIGPTGGPVAAPSAAHSLPGKPRMMSTP